MRPIAIALCATVVSGLSSVFAAASEWAPEDELLGKLPEIFAKSAEHYKALDSDLARGKAAVVSSEENAGTIAKNLTDGDEKTRWGSAHRDGEWIQLDLGKTYKISTVELDWENARAVDYDVLVSVDGQAWKAAAEQRGAKGGLEKHVFKPLSARYVKVLGIKRNTTYGISLFRFSVFARE